MNIQSGTASKNKDGDLELSGYIITIEQGEESDKTMHEIIIEDFMDVVNR